MTTLLLLAVVFSGLGQAAAAPCTVTISWYPGEDCTVNETVLGTLEVSGQYESNQKICYKKPNWLKSMNRAGGESHPFYTISSGNKCTNMYINGKDECDSSSSSGLALIPPPHGGLLEDIAKRKGLEHPAEGYEKYTFGPDHCVATDDEKYNGHLRGWRFFQTASGRAAENEAKDAANRKWVKFTFSDNEQCLCDICGVASSGKSDFCKTSSPTTAAPTTPTMRPTTASPTVFPTSSPVGPGRCGELTVDECTQGTTNLGGIPIKCEVKEVYEISEDWVAAGLPETGVPATIKNDFLKTLDFAETVLTDNTNGALGGHFCSKFSNHRFENRQHRMHYGPKLGEDGFVDKEVRCKPPPYDCAEGARMTQKTGKSARAQTGISTEETRERFDLLARIKADYDKFGEERDLLGDGVCDCNRGETSGGAGCTCHRCGSYAKCKRCAKWSTKGKDCYDAFNEKFRKKGCESTRDPTGCQWDEWSMYQMMEECNAVSDEEVCEKVVNCGGCKAQKAKCSRYEYGDFPPIKTVPHEKRFEYKSTAEPRCYANIDINTYGDGEPSDSDRKFVYDRFKSGFDVICDGITKYCESPDCGKALMNTFEIQCDGSRYGPYFSQGHYWGYGWASSKLFHTQARPGVPYHLVGGIPRRNDELLIRGRAMTCPSYTKRRACRGIQDSIDAGMKALKAMLSCFHSSTEFLTSLSNRGRTIKASSLSVGDKIMVLEDSARQDDQEPVEAEVLGFIMRPSGPSVDPANCSASLFVRIRWSIDRASADFNAELERAAYLSALNVSTDLSNCAENGGSEVEGMGLGGIRCRDLRQHGWCGRVLNGTAVSDVCCETCAIGARAPRMNPQSLVGEIVVTATHTIQTHIGGPSEKEVSVLAADVQAGDHIRVWMVYEKRYVLGRVTSTSNFTESKAAYVPLTSKGTNFLIQAHRFGAIVVPHDGVTYIDGVRIHRDYFRMLHTFVMSIKALAPPSIWNATFAPSLEAEPSELYGECVETIKFVNNVVRSLRADQTGVLEKLSDIENSADVLGWFADNFDELIGTNSTSSMAAVYSGRALKYGLKAASSLAFVWKYASAPFFNATLIIDTFTDTTTNVMNERGGERTCIGNSNPATDFACPEGTSLLADAFNITNLSAESCCSTTTTPPSTPTSMSTTPPSAKADGTAETNPDSSDEGSDANLNGTQSGTAETDPDSSDEGSDANLNGKIFTMSGTTETDPDSSDEGSDGTVIIGVAVALVVLVLVFLAIVKRKTSKVEGQ